MHTVLFSSFFDNSDWHRRSCNGWSKLKFPSSLFHISLSQSAATKKKPKKKKGGGGGGGGAVTRVTSAGKGSIELHQLLMSFLLFWTELSQGKLWKLLVEDVSQHYLYEIEL